jgi:hypothetical protein
MPAWDLILHSCRRYQSREPLLDAYEELILDSDLIEIAKQVIPEHIIDCHTHLRRLRANQAEAEAKSLLTPHPNLLPIASFSLP